MILLTIKSARRLRDSERPSQGYVGTGLYHGYVDGRQIVKDSRTPFFDSARNLLNEGVDPETVLAMQHKGSKYVALRGKVGHAAKFSISEGPLSGPTLIKFREFPLPPQGGKWPSEGEE